MGRYSTWANAVIGSGSYTGNNTANRAIEHGLGKIPKFIALVENPASTRWITIIDGDVLQHNGEGDVTYAVTEWDSTNFYIGNATNYINSFNATSTNYYWVALS